MPPFWAIVKFDLLSVVKLAIAKEPNPIVPVAIAIDVSSLALEFMMVRSNNNFDVTTILDR